MSSSSRPRLLLLAPSADGYGSDRAMVGLLGQLGERFDVTLVSAADGPMLIDARARGAEVVVTPDWALRRRNVAPRGLPASALRVLASLRVLRRLDRERSFDLVYANTVANMLLPVLRWAVRAPVVVHVREVPRTDARLNSIFFGRIAGVARSVLCNSSYTADFVTEIEPRLAGRTVVVHDGVDPVPAVGAVERPDAGPLEIVCVGRIHPQKGQRVLVDALAAGVAAGHDWRVHFWGDALAEHRALQDEIVAAVAGAGLSDRVVWHGYSSDVASMYRGMHVAVVPSTWPEGFSLVTAEAQAAGLPVIATGPGGPSDIVVEGVTGRVVPFEDPSAICEALVELEDADRRRSWGEAGRRRIDELFTTERSARAVTEALVRAAS